MNINEGVLGIMGYPLNQSIKNFQSKAEAIQFAIEFTASSSMGGRKVELEAAKELFDFICKNVELPNVRPNPADGLVEFAKEYIEKLSKVKDTVNEQL